MSEDDGLISAYRLDGNGGGERIATWDQLSLEADKRTLWVHLDHSAETAANWLRVASGLRPLIQEALLAEETRPRCLAVDEGILLNLRGVNLNPGSDPEDMVSIRLWLEKDRIVSTRHRRLMAIEDLRQALARGQGPQDTGAFAVMLAERLTARMDPVLDTLQDRLDQLEDTIITALSRELRTDLAALRRQTIMLRRYIAPQREALRRLAVEEIDWLTQRRRDRLMEISDRVTRYMEDLDVIRDRASVINDELANRLAERMDRTMYLLSLVTLIFLPLTVISGMLGMNVGGVPGEDIPWAFAAACALFAFIGAFEVWLLRRMKWWL
jgi:zinc transporter